MYIVRTNENGNQWRLFFVCPSKYSNKAHCNYFKFAGDDDDDVTSIICFNTGSRQPITTEELYELRTTLSEMKMKCMTKVEGFKGWRRN
ncbi:hypothetical protein ACSBR2_035975 [Camellia fascicularis]